MIIFKKTSAIIVQVKLILVGSFILCLLVYSYISAIIIIYLLESLVFSWVSRYLFSALYLDIISDLLFKSLLFVGEGYCGILFFKIIGVKKNKTKKPNSAQQILIGYKTSKHQTKKK